MKVRVFVEVKSGRWTVWTEDGKTHLGYRRSLCLEGVQFHVDQRKRKQVIRTGRRMPHAWITGTLRSGKAVLPKLAQAVTYNPFTHVSFIRGGRKVDSAKFAIFTKSLAVYS